ncbi:hypothetical protein FACS1894218_1120 [Bacilli bacterium]|nr:hypothetical protein FACS1894218_1120 [Bacilli bacterium]
MVKTFDRQAKTHLTLQQMNNIFDEKNILFVKLIKKGLTPNCLINGTKQLINEAKSKGLKVIIVSQSANAMLEMKRLGIDKKVDYITDFHSKALKSLSDDEKEHFSTMNYTFKKLGLTGPECIVFANRVSAIKRYRAYGVYTVGIANYEHEDEIKYITDYSVDMPEQINFDEIIFNYYINEDKKNNQ